MKLYRLAQGTETDDQVPARAATIDELAHLLDVALSDGQRHIIDAGDHSYPGFLTAVTESFAKQIVGPETGWIWVVPEHEPEPSFVAGWEQR